MGQGVKMVRRNVWPTIIFLFVTTAITVVGVPLYVRHFGIALSDGILFLCFTALTGLGISESDHQAILQSVVSTSLTSLESMFTARSSHLARVALPGTDPPAAGSRTSQLLPPTHPLPPSSDNPLRSAARAPV